MSLDGFFGVVGPDLARENAFRVTGLPVDVSARMIRRREQELTVRARLGTSLNEGSLLPLDPPPDLPAVQDALQRLRDPVLRLADEFFWFWPLAPDGPDEALECLRAGDSQQAAQVWLCQSAGRARAMATHNLAVLALIQALDSETYSTMRWSAAFELCARLFAEDGFWDVLASRIAELKDPRLSAVSSGGVRRRLPERLLALSAGTAVRLARADRAEDARRHVALIRDSGLADHRTVDSVLSKAFDFEFARIRGLAENLERKMTADRVDGLVEDVDAFLAEAEPALARLQAVLPDAVLREVRNDVAEIVVRCVVFRLRFVRDLKNARRLVSEVRPHATEPELRDAIAANLEQFDEELVLNSCWFCKKNESDPGAAFEQMLTRNPLQGAGLPSMRQLFDVKRTVRVPCCVPCNKRYQVITLWTGAGCLSIPVVLIVAFVLFFIHTAEAAIILVAVAAVPIFFVLKRGGRHARKVAHLAWEFPAVIQYQAEGWEIDKGPKAGR